MTTNKNRIVSFNNGAIEIKPLRRNYDTTIRLVSLPIEKIHINFSNEIKKNIKCEMLLGR